MTTSFSAYPSEYTKYLRNAGTNKLISMLLLRDEYVFGCYFAALIQCLADENNSAIETFVDLVKTDSSFSDFSDIAVDPETIVNSVMGAKINDVQVFMQSLVNQFGQAITVDFTKDFLYGIGIFRFINEKDYATSAKMLSILINNVVDVGQANQIGRLLVSHNVEHISHFLKLTEFEEDLIKLNYFCTTDARTLLFMNHMNRLFTSIPMFSRTLIESMLGTKYNSASFNETVQTSIAVKFGIAQVDLKTFSLRPMSKYWVEKLNQRTETESQFIESFITKVESAKPSFASAMAKPANERDEQILLNLIDNIVDKISNKEHEDVPEEDLTANNFLIYGAKNLDKLGYVYKMLMRQGLTPYTPKTDSAVREDFQSICYIAQKCVEYKNEDNGNCVFVVPNAVDSLAKYRSRPKWYEDMFFDVEDVQPLEKTEADEILLLNNPVPTIWVTDRVSAIDPENVGRFMVHLELKGGSRQDRLFEINQVCTELNFSQELAQELSMYSQLNVQQIKSAAKSVKIMHIDPADSNREDLMRQLVKNSQKALNRDEVEQLRASVTKYNLDLLNISGSMDPEKIIKALKKRPKGSMCFYGLPGTGKTALAEHIAMQLDKSIIIKPASELLSKWVGEAEKNIAEMFEEAASQDAILLLDEADSFLRDRSTAKANWEVTQVNELLQRMERFNGIFICTTNLFKSIDFAALRRFTFKLEFLALSPEQRMKMFTNEAGIDYNSLTPEEIDHYQVELQLIQHLTPGDFATVKRQAELLDETLTTQQWLDRLYAESRAKLEHVERSMQDVAKGLM